MGKQTITTGLYLIYVTCPDRAEAERIARDLLDLQLIACANILSPHTAIYRWQGKVERAEETAMILKSRAALFPRIKNEILKRHSYECPCIVGWCADDAHAPYLQWIESETGGA